MDEQSNYVVYKEDRDNYWSIGIKGMCEIRKKYKIIEVDYLDPELVKSKMSVDEDFKNDKNKTEIVNKMMDYYLGHRDVKIYKKTDFLCNKKEKVCVCNTHAADFRRIYDGAKYRKDDVYISWFNL